MIEEKERLIYSTKDIKDILGIGNTTVQRLFCRDTNPIPHFRIGRRIIVPCDQFQEWLINQVTNTQGDNDATLHP